MTTYVRRTSDGPVYELLGGDGEALDDVDGDRIRLNFGPQHPSSHGVLQLDGETVTDCRPVVGYLHTGIEKSAEFRSWTQGVTFLTRADYLSPIFNETVYCLGVERLLGVEAPPRAQLIRVLLLEINASRRIWSPSARPARSWAR